RLSPRHIEPAEVARFLIFDTRLPRSITYCLSEIQAMLEMLRRNFGLRNSSSPVEHIENLLSGLEIARHDDKLLERLHAFSDWVQRCLIELTDALGQTFFGYAQEPETSGQSQSQPSQSQSQSATSSHRA